MQRTHRSFQTYAPLRNSLFAGADYFLGAQSFQPRRQEGDCNNNE
jgi:hypothetical protein